MADGQQQLVVQNGARSDRPVVQEPPQSRELERAVLAVLLDGRYVTAVQVVRPKLEHPLAFYHRDHRLIFQACLDLDDEGHRIDAQAIAEQLRRTSFQVALDRLRHQQLLLEQDSLDGLTRTQRRSLYRWRPEDEAAAIEDSALAATGGHAVKEGLERNAELVRDDYLKRRLIQRLGRIGDEAHRTTKNFAELVDTASQHLLELSKLSQGMEIYDMPGVVSETLDLIQERASNPVSGVATGYPEIDELLMSLRPGGLYVLAARPGVGKTSFALSILQHVCCDAAEPAGALFFSLEVDRLDLVKKLLCGKGGIEFKKLEMGTLDDGEWQALSDAAESLQDWQLDLMDVSDLTVQGMRSVVKRHVLERRDVCKLVVIDYLQLLGSTRPNLSEYEKISEISRTLKILARELSLPVVALSQMSRESERAAGKPREPRLSDLRGSGSIEQDADAVLFLHRVDAEDDANTAHEGRHVKLIVAKNRFGPTGGTDLRFFPGRQRFVVAPKEEMARGGPSPVPEVPRHERLDARPSADEDLFRPA